MLIASFDMGTRNFAFCVEYVELDDLPQYIKPSFQEDGTPTTEYSNFLQEIYNVGEIIECQKVDLLELSNSYSNIYITLTVFLDRFSELWDRVSIILIEQQMAYGRSKSNIQALRLAQHCLSYFYCLYGNFKIIQEFSSTHKTRVLGCPLEKRKTHKSRKDFSVQLVRKLLRDRHDSIWDTFQKFSKKDDISDCILMIQAFKATH